MLYICEQKDSVSEPLMESRPRHQAVVKKSVILSILEFIEKIALN